MELRSALADICNKVYAKGFVASYDGNLSARIDDRSILITPSGQSKGEIKPDDLLVVDYEGNIMEGSGKASTEIKIHFLTYKARPEVNAVIHCHPVYATAFAVIGEGLSRPVFPEVVLGLGKVPLCRYGTPSTEELSDSMKPYINFAWAFLLENHGAVTLGSDIKDAYYKMEKLEHAAHIMTVARMIGREKSLSLMQLKKLYETAEKSHGIKIDKRNRFDY